MKLLSLIFLIALALPGLSQTIPVFHPKPVAAKKTKKTASGMNTAKTAAKKPAAATGLLLLVANLDCDIILDGKSIGKVIKDVPISATTPFGKHLISCRSVDGKDMLTEEVDVQSAAQVIINLDLLSVKKERLKTLDNELITELAKNKNVRIEKIKELILAGADVHVKVNGISPVTGLALDLNNMDFANFIINNGADINSIPKYGEVNWLSMCIRLKQYDMAKLLISKGAMVIRTKQDDPVYQAIMNNATEIIFALNDKNIDWNITPQGDATSYNGLISPENDLSLFRIALKTKSIPMVKLLIAKGADVNYENTQLHIIGPLGYSLLENSSLDMIQLLIDRGANINKVYANWQGSALHMATGMNRLDMIGLLIRNGANINIQDANGQTPLFDAAQSCTMEAVQLFIAKGANVNIKDRDGHTALYYTKDLAFDERKKRHSFISTSRNCIKVKQFLEDHGAK